jgi:hypothetical protein
MNEQPKITPRVTEVLQAQAVPKPEPIPRHPIQNDPLRPQKVALLGTAPSSRMLAPFQDPSWTIWGSSPANAHGNLPRVDAWFELHKNFLWPEYRSYGEPYLKWLNEQTFPVVAQDEELIPRAQRYPIERMIEKFGPYFFTSSFAYMMAYAIDVGVKEMALFGVDMASKDEYIAQRSGGHYFISIAQQHGIKVLIPSESDLAQPPPLYGYAEVTPFGRKIAARDAELKGRINAMEAEKQRIDSGITYLRGALEDIDYFKSIWSGVGGAK